MSLRILIVGAGAVGGYFGARLAAAGRDVTFLVRPHRAEALRAQGLQVKSPHGDLTLQPKLTTAETLSGAFDLIFLSVKAYALEGAMHDLAPAVGANSMILPVLNGMAHMDRLQDHFGRSYSAWLMQVAQGYDERPVVVESEPKSMSRETTFERDLHPRHDRPALSSSCSCTAGPAAHLRPTTPRC